MVPWLLTTVDILGELVIEPERGRGVVGRGRQPRGTVGSGERPTAHLTTPEDGDSARYPVPFGVDQILRVETVRPPAHTEHPARIEVKWGRHTISFGIGCHASHALRGLMLSTQRHVAIGMPADPRASAHALPGAAHDGQPEAQARSPGATQAVFA